MRLGAWTRNKKMSSSPSSVRSISTTRGTVKSTGTREQGGSIFLGRKRSGISTKDGRDRSMNSSVTSRFWREYFKLPPEIRRKARKAFQLWKRDRKSTRLNSSHLGISYAVF